MGANESLRCLHRQQVEEKRTPIYFNLFRLN